MQDIQLLFVPDINSRIILLNLLKSAYATQSYAERTSAVTGYARCSPSLLLLA